MIVSFVPGRVRLRFKELKNKGITDVVYARIKDIPGITTVEIKPLTGSILIEYDVNILPSEKLFALGREELAKASIRFEDTGGL
jgi:copper chaperone CopZ